jgi:hypothetical protein
MALETAASVITFWDFVPKINNIRLEVKDAPGECQKYRDGLRGIACVCWQVLNDELRHI